MGLFLFTSPRPTRTNLRVAEADADRIVNAQNVGHTRPRVRIVDQLQRRRHTVGRDVLLARAHTRYGANRRPNI